MPIDMTNTMEHPTRKSNKLQPLQAVRAHCLECCNGSPGEVRKCDAKSCPLWPHRFGQKPTEELLNGIDDRLIYPLEAEQTGSDVRGRSALKAIRSRCLDCVGCPKEVRGCRATDCDLHPYRMGKSGRQLSEEQKEAAAERARALVRIRQKN